ncbi:type 1 glutamine amidotransferase domain-containing protein [Tanticharoenia sakaeratensis]|jgi:protease I|uniref:Protease protein n=1 Tax=Tanticharoenia sakaeratensis NBRC 103193 TaxID=1231623 RepID=A0A0D6MJE4_9PROT|nr:type 1 glutamine amidotransferase domain-containing protein [Tanticharoenia sakaeratensis]GAN53590.1 protease protein [Tanticharoenia sakaeratensis NBRC 103193]GBQ17460.1 protease I [Tanticharoenia sakaeratensis NBRC 103193]
MGKLDGKKVAVLATDGVEEIEYNEPVKALHAAGAQVTLVSIESGQIQAMNADVKPASRLEVGARARDLRSNGFAALVLPGGTTNPDKLRMDDDVVEFVKGFVSERKPIAAICHGAWTLINAGGVSGHTMTSWPSLRVDLENAGATWVDQEAVQHGTLLTSRNPHDLPAFCQALIPHVLGERAG